MPTSVDCHSLRHSCISVPVMKMVAYNTAIAIHASLLVTFYALP